MNALVCFQSSHQPCTGRLPSHDAARDSASYNTYRYVTRQRRRSAEHVCMYLLMASELMLRRSYGGGVSQWLEHTPDDRNVAGLNRALLRNLGKFIYSFQNYLGLIPPNKHVFSFFCTIESGTRSDNIFCEAVVIWNSAMDGPKPGLRKEEGRAWGQHPNLVKKTTLQKHAQQMKTILPSWKRLGLVYQGV